MNEQVGAASFLFGVLAADPALQAEVGSRIFSDFAPEKLPGTDIPVGYPLIVFSLVRAADTRGLGTYRAMARLTYLVRVVSKGGGYGALHDAANRIDALLTVREPVEVTAGSETYTVHGCVRDQPFARAELMNGVRYVNLGGLYSMNVQ